MQTGDVLPTSPPPPRMGAHRGNAPVRSAQAELDRAIDRLQRRLSERMQRALRWLRGPSARWVRIPLGVLLIAQSAVFFLPLAGLQFLPVGILLLAIDVPFLRRPAARLLRWIEGVVLRITRWRRARRRRLAARSAPS